MCVCACVRACARARVCVCVLSFLGGRRMQACVRLCVGVRCCLDAWSCVFMSLPHMIMCVSVTLFCAHVLEPDVRLCVSVG
jgi:hypothetical protein